jgi:hypothetical protein
VRVPEQPAGRVDDVLLVVFAFVPGHLLSHLPRDLLRDLLALFPRVRMAVLLRDLPRELDRVLAALLFRDLGCEMATKCSDYR